MKRVSHPVILKGGVDEVEYVRVPRRVGIDKLKGRFHQKATLSAPPTGLEPVAPYSASKCSNPLSYEGMCIQLSGGLAGRVGFEPTVEVNAPTSA